MSCLGATNNLFFLSFVLGSVVRPRTCILQPVLRYLEPNLRFFFSGKRFSFLAFYIPFLPIYLAYSIDSSCLYLVCIVSFFVLHCFLFVRAFFAWLGWFIDRLDQPRILFSIATDWTMVAQILWQLLLDELVYSEFRWILWWNVTMNNTFIPIHLQLLYRFILFGQASTVRR